MFVDDAECGECTVCVATVCFTARLTAEAALVRLTRQCPQVHISDQRRVVIKHSHDAGDGQRTVHAAHIAFATHMH
jgi:hypothetical protein